MNGKQAKKLRGVAAMIYQSIPEAEGKTKKPVSLIYEELKTVHKNKPHNASKKRIA